MAIFEAYFLPWGKHVKTAGYVEVKLKKETAKAYLLRVEDEDRPVEFWVPKSQSKVTDGGIYVRKWVMENNPEGSLACLMIGEHLKEVEV
jgi:hypothetical protein